MQKKHNNNTIYDKKSVRSLFLYNLTLNFIEVNAMR